MKSEETVEMIIQSFVRGVYISQNLFSYIKRLKVYYVNVVEIVN